MASAKAPGRRRKLTRCIGCAYWRPLSRQTNGIRVCHYCLDTGQPRGVPAKECYVKKIYYEERKKNR